MFSLLGTGLFIESNLVRYYMSAFVNVMVKLFTITYQSFAKQWVIRNNNRDKHLKQRVRF